MIPRNLTCPNRPVSHPTSCPNDRWLRQECKSGIAADTSEVKGFSLSSRDHSPHVPLPEAQVTRFDFETE
jgi:hypothetical protein